MPSQMRASEIRMEVCSPRSLAVVDSIWALAVCHPALCLYWRGCWSLMTYYVLPNQVPGNYWLMAALGSVFLATLWLLEPLKAYLRDASRLKYSLVTRLLLMYQGWLYMFFWWGIWGLGDHYFGTTPVGLVGCLVASLGSLVFMGCLRTVMFPPYNITLDTRPELLNNHNLFGTSSLDGPKFVWDTFLSSVVAQAMSILLWRTGFAILNQYLYPNDPLRSDVICYVFGLAGTVLLFALQEPLGAVSERLEGTGHTGLKIMWEDAVYIVVLLFLIPIWRGIWNLNIRYFITDDCLGGWVNYVVGTMALLANQTFSYVGVWGAAIDGSTPGGGGIFPLRYFRDLKEHYRYDLMVEIPVPCEEHVTQRHHLSDTDTRRDRDVIPPGDHSLTRAQPLHCNSSINYDEQGGEQRTQDDDRDTSDPPLRRDIPQQGGHSHISALTPRTSRLQADERNITTIGYVQSAESYTQAIINQNITEGLI